MTNAADFDSICDDLVRVRAELARHIIGQDQVIDLVLAGILSRGHVLLLGVPGLAKTKLVDTIGRVLGLSTARVQCTPDLMPSDVIGAEVLETDANGGRSFRFIEGPVFTQLLMVDEINRASPRTQSAFLQAMQERSVSVAGQTRPLPAPFHVLATQNPIEQEGTYPLPEAQLDRFLLQVNVDFPTRAAERDIITATTTGQRTQVHTILSADRLIQIQDFVETMPLPEQVVEAMLTLVRRARPGGDGLKDIQKYLEWAPGIRATQTLSLTARARALLMGRAAPSTEDVLALALPALQHRLRLTYTARADGVDLAELVRRLGAGL